MRFWMPAVITFTPELQGCSLRQKTLGEQYCTQADLGPRGQESPPFSPTLATDRSDLIARCRLVAFQGVVVILIVFPRVGELLELARRMAESASLALLLGVFGFAQTKRQSHDDGKGYQ